MNGDDFPKAILEMLFPDVGVHETLEHAANCATAWVDAWSDIETRNGASGKPTVSLSGKVKEIADELGIEEISISITHAGGLAIASAIAIGS